MVSFIFKYRPFFWPVISICGGFLSLWISVNGFLAGKIKSQTGPGGYATYADDPVYVTMAIVGTGVMGLLFIVFGLYLIRVQIREKAEYDEYEE